MPSLVEALTVCVVVEGCKCGGEGRGRKERTAQGQEIAATHKTADNSIARTGVSLEEWSDAWNTGVVVLYV